MRVECKVGLNHDGSPSRQKEKLPRRAARRRRGGRPHVTRATPKGEEGVERASPRKRVECTRPGAPGQGTPGRAPDQVSRAKFVESARQRLEVTSYMSVTLPPIGMLRLASAGRMIRLSATEEPDW